MAECIPQKCLLGTIDGAKNNGCTEKSVLMTPFLGHIEVEPGSTVPLAVFAIHVNDWLKPVVNITAPATVEAVVTDDPRESIHDIIVIHY
jgi:hypothetical protein